MLSSVIPFFSCLQSFPASGYFQMNRMRWPKYWSFSFSISPSNEYSRLVSFRIDWFALLAVLGSLKSLLERLEKILERILRTSHKYTYVPFPLDLPSIRLPPSQPSRSSQSTELSSHQLSVLLKAVHICQSQYPNSSHLWLFPCRQTSGFPK